MALVSEQALQSVQPEGQVGDEEFALLSHLTAWLAKGKGKVEEEAGQQQPVQTA